MYLLCKKKLNPMKNIRKYISKDLTENCKRGRVIDITRSTRDLFSELSSDIWCRSYIRLKVKSMRI